jgi:predicted CxxxxCH...CXXCH cytochrome family protein
MLAAYGGTENLSDQNSHIFQCGTCHPVSSALHMDGNVDVELYSAQAPDSSLKGLNPPTAAYTAGTCSDVYCHSRTDWSSGAVSQAKIEAGTGIPLQDANGNLVYDPYVVTETRVYTSVGWTDSDLGCNGCHRNSPQTVWPTVQAAVGDSHAGVSELGYEDLHSYNHGASEPVPCRTCHVATVVEVMTWVRTEGDVTIFDDAPIADRSYHVNGTNDVVFDSGVSFTPSYTYSLSATTYDPQTRVCSSVPCHKGQPNPQWGLPYRSEFAAPECNQCHRMAGSWAPPGEAYPPDESVQRSTGQGRNVLIARDRDHYGSTGQDCVDCHATH